MTVTSNETNGEAAAGLMLGKRRALQTLSSRGGIFSILAVDHIGALSTVLRPRNPSSVDSDDLIILKVQLVEAFADLASGVLIDPVLGLGPVVRSGVLPGSTGLMIGLEDGDYASLDSEPRLFPDWDVARAAKSGASAIKCSFIYDPFSESEAASSFVSELVSECGVRGLPLFAEPLTPVALQGDQRAVVVETARQIGALGVDILKLEFPLANSGDEAEWKDACLEVNEASPRPWTILSGGEDFETYARQLSVACAAGASGYVAGRAIWRDLVVGGSPFTTETVLEARRRFQHLTSIAEANGTPWSTCFDSDVAASDGESPLVRSADER